MKSIERSRKWRLAVEHQRRLIEIGYARTRNPGKHCKPPRARHDTSYPADRGQADKPIDNGDPVEESLVVIGTPVRNRIESEMARGACGSHSKRTTPGGQPDQRAREHVIGNQHGTPKPTPIRIVPG